MEGEVSKRLRETLRVKKFRNRAIKKSIGRKEGDSIALMKV